MIAHDCDLFVRLLDGSFREYQRSAQRWWQRDRAERRRRTGRSTSCRRTATRWRTSLGGYARAHRDEIVEFLRRRNFEDLAPRYDEAVAARRRRRSRRTSSTTRCARSSTSRRARRAWTRCRSPIAAAGMRAIMSPGKIDVDAQVIDLVAAASPTNLDPRVRVPGIERLAQSRALIVNIDYPLGMAAYHHLSAVALGVDELRGIYIMGKAATLNGRVGDVMISKVVHDEHSSNTYLFRNALVARRRPAVHAARHRARQPEGADRALGVPAEPRVHGRVLSRGLHRDGDGGRAVPVGGATRSPSRSAIRRTRSCRSSISRRSSSASSTTRRIRRTRDARACCRRACRTSAWRRTYGCAIAIARRIFTSELARLDVTGATSVRRRRHRRRRVGPRLRELVARAPSGRARRRARGRGRARRLLPHRRAGRLRVGLLRPLLPLQGPDDRGVAARADAGPGRAHASSAVAKIRYAGRRHRLSVPEAHPPAAARRVPRVPGRAVLPRRPATRRRVVRRDARTRASARASPSKFLRPYNEKLYATDLDALDVDAMGRFFPHADVADIIANMRPGARHARLQRDVHVSRRRRDPVHPRAAARSAGRARSRAASRVTAIDLDARTRDHAAPHDRATRTHRQLGAAAGARADVRRARTTRRCSRRTRCWSSTSASIARARATCTGCTSPTARVVVLSRRLVRQHHRRRSHEPLRRDRRAARRARSTSPALRARVLADLARDGHRHRPPARRAASRRARSGVRPHHAGVARRDRARCATRSRRRTCTRSAATAAGPTARSRTTCIETRALARRLRLVRDPDRPSEAGTGCP